eukprot:CAMPEP_0113577914 /NCGR_PEP_ID=MMETSP0015_2-20120614/29158_1 /TAXON_ID=2838 /ORGANISM="Odontella" /LENGTH=58 /DNA_ID=CAMNT_0000481597 /DNA_START=66 /DNA_END=242 /DNA_ORIENTATION=+ /assembly_acc=CAM_ASM_000160
MTYGYAMILAPTECVIAATSRGMVEGRRKVFVPSVYHVVWRSHPEIMMIARVLLGVIE